MPLTRSRRAAAVVAIALATLLTGSTAAAAAPEDVSAAMAEFEAHLAAAGARDQAQDEQIAALTDRVAELEAEPSEEPAPVPPAPTPAPAPVPTSGPETEPTPAPAPETASGLVGVTVVYSTGTDRGTLRWESPRSGEITLTRTDSTGRTGTTTQPAELGSYTFAAHASSAEWVEYTAAAGGDAVAVRLDTATGQVIDAATPPPAPEPAPPTSPAPGPVGELSWEPAEGWETHPVRVVPATPGQQTLLKGSGDVVLDLPDTVTGPIIIDGYDDVTIIGGHIRALPVSQIDGVDQRLVYVRNVTGTVHLEGLLLDGDVPGAETDAITANGPFELQVENVRVEGLEGTQGSNHADCIQTWRGLDALRTDGFTCYSGYQGIKFQLVSGAGFTGPVALEDTNLVGLAGQKYLLWVDPGDGTPVELRNVWVDPYGSRPFGQSVWPGITNSTNPARVSGGQACWPTMELVTGCVHEGTPPGGDFVPAGSVGAAYVSPGYGAAA